MSGAKAIFIDGVGTEENRERDKENYKTEKRGLGQISARGGIFG